MNRNLSFVILSLIVVMAGSALAAVLNITSNDVADNHPSLYNGNIVWEGLDGNDLEIFYWNSNGTFHSGYHPIGLRAGDTCEYPPYLPYLVCFSMAWGEDGDYSSRAYYKRLNDLFKLNIENGIHTNQFKKVDDLWGKLEIFGVNRSHMMVFAKDS